MTDTINDGGPAFPTQTFDYDGQGQILQYQEPGMTVRDYFAAAALTGFFANNTVRHGKFDNTWCPEYCARQAYALSDAMLAERNKRNVV